MNRLFLKIFLWFWATVILLGVALVLSFVLGPKGSYLPWQNIQGIAAGVVAAMDRHGTAGANEMLRRLESSQQLQACLFDDTGKPLAGNACESFQESALQALHSEHDEETLKRARAGSVPNASVYRNLLFERGRDGRRYLFATQLPYGPPAVHKTISGFLLHWLLLMIVSSAVCYLLTFRLTRPILRLREASKRITQGDLEARVDASVEFRGDAFGDLGREFNAMAARIEGLLSSQRQLISDVSHELRSPLARMNLALDLARRRLGDDPAFDRLAIDLEKLNEMIGSLLTVARLEGDAVPMEREPVDLGRLVAEIVHDAEIEAHERSCRIVLEGAGAFRVKGDEKLLRSAIENVIRNAVYYTHAGTEIEVRLEPRSRAGRNVVALSVSDRGPGVPEADRENIFRPFYRVAEARDRQSGGAGLGLAIAWRVIRLHRGVIGAANRPGGGLEVGIELPASGLPA